MGSHILARLWFLPYVSRVEAGCQTKPLIWKKGLWQFAKDSCQESAPFWKNRWLFLSPPPNYPHRHPKSQICLNRRQTGKAIALKTETVCANFRRAPRGWHWLWGAGIHLSNLRWFLPCVSSMRATFQAWLKMWKRPMLFWVRNGRHHYELPIP